MRCSSFSKESESWRISENNAGGKIVAFLRGLTKSSFVWGVRQKTHFRIFLNCFVGYTKRVRGRKKPREMFFDEKAWRTKRKWKKKSTKVEWPICHERKNAHWKKKVLLLFFVFVLVVFLVFVLVLFGVPSCYVGCLNFLVVVSGCYLKIFCCSYMILQRFVHFPFLLWDFCIRVILFPVLFPSTW